jgi:hypothetical protein
VRKIEAKGEEIRRANPRLSELVFADSMLNDPLEEHSGTERDKHARGK